MSYKATKPGLVSVLYLSMHYTLLLFIRVLFYVSLVFIAVCSVFWLFWLSYQYLPSDWLERLVWGSLILARGSSPESSGRRVCMIFLVYCIASLFYYVFVLSPVRDILSYCYGVIYSLYVLKVPLNPKQTNKPGTELHQGSYGSGKSWNLKVIFSRPAKSWSQAFHCLSKYCCHLATEADNSLVETSVLLTVVRCNYCAVESN